MQQLVQSILANPYDFDPLDFNHCGLRSLVTVAQECSQKPLELRSQVTRHHVRVSRLERLASA